ncbi:MAG: hypothetical protein ACXW5W_24890 [Candidatus Binatia bacterium]
MYQEIVKSSHRHALHLIVTIATLLGVGSSTNLAAVDTIHVSHPSLARPLGDDQIAGSINPKKCAAIPNIRFQPVTADSQGRPLIILQAFVGQVV